MNTIADKLTYLEDTKTAIGNAIVGKGGSVTGKTFRQYATEISNLPSGGGTKIAVSPDVSEYTGGSAFNFLSQITSVNFPSGITSIDIRSFYYCSGLTSVTIPSSVTSIGTYAFYHCDNLTSVTIPSSVTSIGDNAFNYCNNLTSLSLSNGLISIGFYAFSHIKISGETFTIPSSVTSIGNNAFYNAIETNTLIMNGGGTVGSLSGSNGSGSFESNGSINYLIINDNVNILGNYCFHNCIYLSSVIIGDSVTTLGSGCFQECVRLNTVEIGNGITTIYANVFFKCNSLQSITIKATTPPTLQTVGAFVDTNNCPIYVPAESVEAYKAANNWSTYASRIQAISVE